jgi:hypothetical protein
LNRIFLYETPGNFNTLSLVYCNVQICNGTAVEHGSLLNCSGVCDGINCCKSVENKRCKIFNKVLNMNWDYVRVKKKQKKNKQTKRKQTNKNK